VKLFGAPPADAMLVFDGPAAADLGKPACPWKPDLNEVDIRPGA
jgi:hypothetical protein